MILGSADLLGVSEGSSDALSVSPGASVISGPDAASVFDGVGR